MFQKFLSEVKISEPCVVYVWIWQFCSTFAGIPIYIRVAFNMKNHKPTTSYKNFSKFKILLSHKYYKYCEFMELAVQWTILIRRFSKMPVKFSRFKILGILKQFFSDTYNCEYFLWYNFLRKILYMTFLYDIYIDFLI